MIAGPQGRDAVRLSGSADSDLRNPEGLSGVATAPTERESVSAPGDTSTILCLGTPQPSRQRFENWKLRRALRFPYFLRSTTRLSRVRNPAALSAGRSDGS